jgi:hypothetical protein
MKRVLVCKNDVEYDEEEHAGTQSFLLSRRLRRAASLVVTKKSYCSSRSSKRRTAIVSNRTIKTLLSSPIPWLFFGVLISVMLRSKSLIILSFAEDEAIIPPLGITNSSTWGAAMVIEIPMIEQDTNNASAGGSSTKNNSGLPRQKEANYEQEYHRLDRSSTPVSTTSTSTMTFSTPDGKTTRVTTTTSGLKATIVTEIIGCDDGLQRHSNHHYGRRHHEQEEGNLLDGLPGFSGVVLELELEFM